MTAEQNNLDQFNGYDQAPAIYTMPEKFLPQQKKQKNKSGKGIIIFLYFLIGVVVIGAGLAVWFLFLRTEPGASEKPVINMPPTSLTNPTSSAPTQAEIVPVEIKFVARDTFNNEVSHVMIKLTGIDTELAEKIKVNSLLPEQLTGRASRAIGAIYLFNVTENQNLSQPTTFTFSYVEPDDLTSKKENSLQIAEEISPGTWKYLAGSRLDIVANTISIELASLPQGQVTILSNLDEQEIVTSEPIDQAPAVDDENLVVTPLSPTQDADNDGLTDVEELLYQSNPALPDTDGDGYLDGQEVINGYSPTSANNLLADGLVKEFINEAMGISLYYPINWAIRMGGGEIQSVAFESSGDDFIQISIQENPAGLDIYSWYAQLAPNIDQTLLSKTTVAGLDAIYSMDMANIYVARGDKIYILTYSAGLKTQVDYLTTFAMMQVSLTFLTDVN